MYGPARAGVACALPIVVLFHAPMHVERPTRVQCIISAFYDVHEVQCFHGVILVQRQIVCKFGVAAPLGKGLVNEFHRSTRIKTRNPCYLCVSVYQSLVCSQSLITIVRLHQSEQTLVSPSVLVILMPSN